MKATEEEKAWLENQYVALGHAAGMCDPSNPEDAKHSEKLRTEQKIVKGIMEKLEIKWS